MASRKKTWQEKLADKPGYPKRVSLETRFPCYNAVHKMGAEAGDQVVLVNPSQVVALMRQVPRGRLTTIVYICQNLARRHQAQGCCSLTAGIFIMTAANAAEEAMSEGRDLDIPYWRTLKADGYLNEKYPGGVQAHKMLLEEEGFTVARKGRRYYVAGHEAFLFHDFGDA
jgi:alkylated DNA nucleotide flippase Atl1